MALPSANPDPTPMAAHVEEAVRSVALLHAKHHQDTSNTQRYVSRPQHWLAAHCFSALYVAASFLDSHKLNNASAWIETRRSTSIRVA